MRRPVVGILATNDDNMGNGAALLGGLTNRRPAINVMSFFPKYGALGCRGRGGRHGMEKARKREDGRYANLLGDLYDFREWNS